MTLKNWEDKKSKRAQLLLRWPHNVA